MLEMRARGECVLIWGFTLSGKEGSQGGSQGVHMEVHRGFTRRFAKRGVHKGVHENGGSREPCEPPGYGPEDG